MMKLERLHQKAGNLPKTPGVYLMKNKSGKIIYIGKAKALRNRVVQYFGSQTGHDIKVLKMVSNVDSFDYILTDNESEALVLETSLIKQHKPKYNILLKDDKGYHYIKITKGDWPRISAEKQKLADGATYIGPYSSSFSVTQAVDEVRKIFKLPDCTREFPRDIGKDRPCLNYYISQCSAPCDRKITKGEYRESVRAAVAFLKEGMTSALAQLEHEMTTASANLEFEKAARLRDRITAIERLHQKQKVVANDHRQQDVFAIVRGKDTMCLNVLRFNEGRLFDSEHFFIDEDSNLESVRNTVLVQYYTMREPVPPRIMIDGTVEDSPILEDWLGKKAGRKVSIVIPQRGEQRRLLEMCRKNAAEKLAQRAGHKGKQASALDELAQLLGLDIIPSYIESYDISHTGGTDNVAGMVVFKNGVPYKSAYKRFSIKGFEGQDDYASMAEVLERRFKRYLDPENKDEGFGTLPDLILLDGGIGQVNAVKPVLCKLNIDVPVYGMVKDSSHRTRAIAANGGEISIQSHRKSFTLVSTIQEEVHRWAVNYHHKKRQHSTFRGGLTDIKGIGPQTSKRLLSHFKTVKSIREADVETLYGVPHITKRQAENIYNHFRKS